MKPLLLGGGGREHALGWAIAQSKDCDQLFIAPGNAGTANIGQNVDIDETDFKAIKDLVLEKNIDLVIVGPEKPLVHGIVDFFNDDKALVKVPVLGPDKYAAQLEGSKGFAKDFMHKYGIPTPGYSAFDSEDFERAKEALSKQKPPYVIKADGLASGKGVVICDSYEAALKTLEDYLVHEKLGGAGKKVVIEEFLDGAELSVFILTDGKNQVFLPTARDYKRVGEGDTGPNTGGMGAISPAPEMGQNLFDKIEESIVKPTIQGLHEEGCHFKGFLYFGLILVDNEPYVLEYNVRLGDPEAEVVLPRIKTDLLYLIRQTIEGNLDGLKPEITEEAGATVMMVSGGYPGEYEKGKVIHGLNEVQDCSVFQAGTKKEGDQIKTSGGRVLSVTGLGKNLESAIQKTYKAVSSIQFERAYYRKDIGSS